MVDRYSLDAQRETMRKYSNFQNMEIVREYSDEGHSGKNIRVQSMAGRMQRCKDTFLAFYSNAWYNVNMNKTSYFTIPKDVTYGRGYVYSLQYHIVWVTKYRKPIFVGAIEQDVKNHLLVDCKPQLRLSDAIKILKGNTARWLFLNHPEIKKQLWGGHLWNPSYFVATVSDRTLEQVKSYIDNQKTK